MCHNLWVPVSNWYAVLYCSANISLSYAISLWIRLLWCWFRAYPIGYDMDGKSRKLLLFACSIFSISVKHKWIVSFSVRRIPVISKIINIMIMSKQYLFRIYKITLFSMIEYDIICYPLPCLLPNIFWSVHGVHK